MNIQQAKEEIRHTVAAYLEKDETGEYRIPEIRQRPVLLMGPPGIGKTQIMEQIAAECDIALVSYTITHHTRQSAIGLPYIREKTYGGVPFSVTEYTMSEIIASVYERMEKSGKREGLLFIDEINCVSETLAPAMLQFLQGKSFGNQKVPKGWIIVAAGNPPEYNRSVREFDVVTLDRVKLIPVEPDYGVWKKYAYEAGIHESIISYLDIHRENFYRMETTVDGKAFVTARGWEDLSEMIYACERLGFAVTRDVTGQYLRHERTARDFANYLSLYYQYQTDYQVDEILEGVIRPGTLNRLKYAPFDERIQVVVLLLAKLLDIFRGAKEREQSVGDLFSLMKEFLELQQEKGAELPEGTLARFTALAEKDAQTRQSRMAAGGETKGLLRRQHYMEEICGKIRSAIHDAKEDGEKAAREQFRMQREKLDALLDKAGEKLEAAFDFMETAFGESQEMVVFVTELSVAPAGAWFLGTYDCDRYHIYNKKLLFDEREEKLRARIREMENRKTGETRVLPRRPDPQEE